MSRDQGVPVRMEMLGSFESTYMPAHDVDVTETTGHAARWREDLELLLDCGVTALRYPVRWHRVEAEAGRYDWRQTDAVLGWMHDRGMRPIVDLIHHTSHPRWLELGFADPRFPDAALRYYEAFARRYPWVPGYTLFNEPFTTLFLCGSEAVFPPYLSGLRGFVELSRRVLPTMATACAMYRDLLPRARHLNVDTCERHSAACPEGEEYAEYANDRRFLVTDLLVGRPIDADRPFVRALASAGGEDVLTMEPGHVDVLGLDYYAHSQWQFSGPGVGAGSSSAPGRLDDLIIEYWERYRLPCALGETNIRGRPSDRATWFKYTLEHCENAGRRGVPIEAYCWFPFIDSADWASLLQRADGAIDPVGVFWLDADRGRRESSMSRAFRTIAAGGTSRDLPAYELQPPVTGWVRGYLDQMAHWGWEPPPEEDEGTNAPKPEEWIEFASRAAAMEPPPGAAYQE